MSNTRTRTDSAAGAPAAFPDLGVELREGYAAVGNQKLHYVEAGDGPLIVLLHGFPEFWFGWRRQIARGGGFSGRRSRYAWLQPVVEARGLRGYAVDLLAADIRALIGQLGARSALLVGHDWGGTIAWTTAMNHPEVGGTTTLHPFAAQRARPSVLVRLP